MKMGYQSCLTQNQPTTNVAELNAQWKDKVHDNGSLFSFEFFYDTETSLKWFELTPIFHIEETIALGGT